MTFVHNWLTVVINSAELGRSLFFEILTIGFHSIGLLAEAKAMFGWIERKEKDKKKVLEG